MKKIIILVFSTSENYSASWFDSLSASTRVVHEQPRSNHRTNTVQFYDQSQLVKAFTPFARYTSMAGAARELALSQPAFYFC